jgi:hypothetical protein
MRCAKQKTCSLCSAVFSVKRLKARRFLQDVKQRLSTIDPVTLGVGRLLHDSILFETLNSALVFLLLVANVLTDHGFVPAHRARRSLARGILTRTLWEITQLSYP